MWTLSSCKGCPSASDTELCWVKSMHFLVMEVGYGEGRRALLETQQHRLCTPFADELLLLSSCTTSHGAMAQSSYRVYQCHSRLASPGDWSRTAIADAGTGSAVMEHCSDGWGLLCKRLELVSCECAGARGNFSRHNQQLSLMRC